MENQDFLPLRRAILAGLGALALTGIAGFPAFAQGAKRLALRAVARKTRLKADLPESPVSLLESNGQSASLRLRQGEEFQVSLTSELSSLSAWNLIGFDGLNTIEPLTVVKPAASGATTDLTIPLRQAGTFLLDGRLLDGLAPVTPLIVEDSKPATDRDEVLLIEDWRLMPDGRAIAPGTDPKDAITVYTANRQPSLDLKLRPNERLRLRIINACQRMPIGLKIDSLELRVMAIDSQPAEPFVARDGQLVLAPGSRTDVFIDAPQAGTSAITLFDGSGPRKIGQIAITGDALRPAPLPPASALPSSHLPAQIDLKNATRIELQLDGKAPWIAPSDFTANAAPAFQIKRGRAAVIALTNKDTKPIVFRLHGHHFRLLDRLDDGWKPFWLDTLLLTGGQTQRIAFLAEHSGQWLMESTGIDWVSLRFVRHYSVS
ncbi:MAG: multicopper oxidase domain-containing protein [Rhizobiales bacterium]|nr:multicopper oxidase domain-containing protein [Hyphomicrobiales bacterium]